MKLAMPSSLRLACGVLLFSLGLSVAPATEPEAELRIGVLAHRGKEVALREWGPHADYLNAQLAPRRFSIVPMGFQELGRAAAERDIQFVITNSGHYSQLESDNHLIRLATLRQAGPLGPLDRFGGVVVTLPAREDIHTYADLRGKRLMIPSYTSLGGWQVHLREALDAGIDLRTQTAEIQETQNHESVVTGILAGEADAGLVRSDLLEKMAAQGQLKLADLKVVNLRVEPDFPYLLSTRLYPEWPFAEVRGVADDLAKDVLIALLDLPADAPAARAAGIHGWGLPLSYQPIHDLFREARLGPYAELPISFRDVVAAYWVAISAGAALLFILMTAGLLYAASINRSLRREIWRRNKAELSLEASERRFKTLVFDATAEGIMVTDAQGRITLVNEAFSEITGYAQNEVLGNSPRMLGSGRHPPEFYAAMFRQLQDTGKWQGEIWNRRKSGELYPVWQSISSTTNAKGRLTGYISLFSDITHLKQSEAQLLHLAYHDPLTGLPNRLLFDERLGHAIEQARRRQEMLAVLFFDLDNFKPVNDRLGHQMGDELLEGVAQRLSTRLRKSDTLSRRGGDEFTVLVENIDGIHDAIEIAEDINVQLRKPFRLSGQQEVTSACSIGIAIFPEHGETARDLIEHADAAMYRVKQASRGHYCVYTPDMCSAAETR
jgi:diguanylate cyclase (GGDEF)-like protein/PAS domain S-box-containing protein